MLSKSDKQARGEQPRSRKRDKIKLGPPTRASLLILLPLALLTGQPEVGAWRLFDLSAAESSARSMYNVGPLQGSTLAFNPPINTHLMLPAMQAEVRQPQQAQPLQPVNEPLKPAGGQQEAASVASTLVEAADNLLQNVLDSAAISNKSSSPALSAKQTASSIASTIVANAIVDTANKYAVGANESSSENSTPFKLRDVSSQPSSGTKLFQSVLMGNVSSGVDKMDRVLSQILKPRNEKSPAASKSQLSEQQIISQHARVQHSQQQQHQRLLPTKQRDQKIVSFLDASSSAGNQQRDSSALVSILNNLRLSGISSRSSIVKAISDNKLGRTLSTVGKSISANKYVAGAAAASALAALGLTMSKLFSPYLLSGSYSKLGDPMLTSGSYVSPATLAMPPANAGMGSYYFAAPNYDQMATAATTPYGSNYNLLAGSPSFDLSSSPSLENYSFQQQTDPGASQVVFRQQANPKQSGTDFSGHYTDFYNQQGLSSPEFQLPAGQTPGFATYSTRAEANQIGATTAGFAVPESQFGGSPMESLQQQYADQLVPSSSVDYPTYLQQQHQQQLKQQPGKQLVGSLAVKPSTTAVTAAGRGTNSRRSGAVALKLNEATKARLNQYFQRYQTRAPAVTYSDAVQSASGAQVGESPGRKELAQRRQPASGNQAQVFVPVTNANSVNSHLRDETKSVRFEADESRQASAGSKKPAQLREKGQQAKTQVSFMYIRPKSGGQLQLAEWKSKSQPEEAAGSEPKAGSQSAWLSLTDSQLDKQELVAGGKDNIGDESKATNSPPSSAERPLRVSRTAGAKKGIQEKNLQPAQQHETAEGGENLIEGRQRQTAMEFQGQAQAQGESKPHQVTLEHWQQVASLTSGQQSNNESGAGEEEKPQAGQRAALAMVKQTYDVGGETLPMPPQAISANRQGAAATAADLQAVEEPERGQQPTQMGQQPQQQGNKSKQAGQAVELVTSSTQLAETDDEKLDKAAYNAEEAKRRAK